MKKGKLVIALAAFGMIALTSCKKDWTCECTTTTSGDGMSGSATVSATINDTKSNAEEACESGTTEVTVGGTTSKTECKIK